MKLLFLILLAVSISLSSGSVSSGLTNQELFESQTGSVEFIISCGTNAVETVVFVKPDSPEYEDWAGYPVVVNPRIPSERFIPGKYIATLYNGNAYNEEVRRFVVESSGVTRVSFVGQPLPSNFRPVCFSIGATATYDISQDSSWSNGIWVLTINQNTESKTVTIDTTIYYRNIPSEYRRDYIEVKPGYDTHWIDIPIKEVPISYTINPYDACGNNPNLIRPLVTPMGLKARSTPLKENAK